jgi:prolyl 4-hydroxylase
LYQTTNYGLGGLCESHIDPHGYIEGMELTSSRRELIYSGDMIATFMAWLNDVKSGGNTACDWIGYEQTMTPTRGSAAFWMNLDKKGFRERRSQHTGCPVLGGSKWILNKWVYYFDQFKSYPCGLDYHEAFGPFTGYYK